MTISSVYNPLPIASSMRIHRVKMIMAMKVEIKTRKLIKPSVSTPPNLRRYNLSFIDEFAPNTYVPLVLFFPHNNTSNYTRSTSQLEESLEKTLTLMYPLSGRYIKDICTIHCNDQGAEFIQAQVDITLQELFDLKVNPKEINKFIPYLMTTGQVKDPMLAIQVTMFQCGGLAVGVSIAHRIGDASTLVTFLNQWATLSRRDTNVEISGISFSSSSLFPKQLLSPMETGIVNITNKDDYVTVKLLFNERAISKMKTKATQNGNINTNGLSKVQLVSALIWKAFIDVDRAVYGYPRHSVLVQPLNLRRKTSSLIPVNAFGNLWGLILTSCDTAKMINEFEDLTYLLTNQVKKAIKDYSKAAHDNHERKELVLDSFSQFTNVSDTTNLIWLTSWCKFPYYNVDFGFGKPVWMSCGCPLLKRGMVLLDDSGGNGVEAFVSMGEEDVPYFEQDNGIKSFSV